MSQKKSSLVAGNRPGEKFLLSTRPHTSNVYDNIYCFKKTHTNKKIRTSKFIRTNLRFFPLQTIKVGPFVFQ